MCKWGSDEKLFNLVQRELYTPVVGDILDTLGRDIISYCPSRSRRPRPA